jgi:hypothetical protein
METRLFESNRGGQKRGQEWANQTISCHFPMRENIRRINYAVNNLLFPRARQITLRHRRRNPQGGGLQDDKAFY